MEERPERVRRRRWRRVVLVLFLLLVGGLVAAWELAPGYARGRIERELERSLRVQASVGSLTLSLAGDARLEALTLTDEAGAPVGSVGSIQVDLSPRELLRRHVRGTIAIADADVHVVQAEDGTWNLAGLARGGEGGPPGGGGAPPAPPRGGSELPAIDLALSIHPLTVHLVPRGEPERTLQLDLSASLEHGDRLELQRLALASDFLRGTVEGHLEGLSRRAADPASPLLYQDVQGDLTYVPDALRAVLAPFFAVDLQGATEEPLRFMLEGQVGALDPAALVRGAKGHLEAGVGSLTVEGFTAQGEVKADLADGKVTTASDMTLNGGSLAIDGAVDVGGLLSDSGAGDTQVSVRLGQVGVSTAFAPLLSSLHPLLASSDALARGTLGGLVDAELALSTATPLRLDELSGAPGAFPLSALRADGTVGLTATLTDSPLVADLARGLGIDLAGGAHLAPIAFAVSDGRIAYSKPWKWTFGGVATAFTGSVGLDRSLDLVWHVPLTEALRAKSPLLAHLTEDELAFPLTGTLTAPRLELRDTLARLAQEAARNGLEEKVLQGLRERGLLGKDEGLDADTLKDRAKEELQSRLGLGGGKEDAAGGDDPKALLAEADRLWDQGDHAAAAPLYRRLKEEFRISLPYALNRKRIDARAKQKP